MSKTIKQQLEEVTREDGLLDLGKYDHEKLEEMLKERARITRGEERLALIETIKECGHQQEDDSIWCNMDEVLKNVKNHD